MEVNEKWIKYMIRWRKDWCCFAREVLGAKLDSEQEDILHSVQVNPLTAVASGVARGKDFISAVACISFMYLTPTFNSRGELVGNTKVAMTAPTGRQVYNIMMPEIARQFKNAKFLPGTLMSSRIKTNYEEWFLTGFKAGDDATEAWSGFHAVNVMFAVTEASGISETVFNAIEGNLQGNSRLLIVFNPNVTSGYAAKAMSSDRFAKFRLSSLNAENVVKKQLIIPGQVDYRWVADKVENWCTPVYNESDFDEGEGDFKWEGGMYRPNDLFRVKVLGLFPRASEDCLIPYEWVTLAQERWRKKVEEMGEDWYPDEDLFVGVDVAGMGRDSSNLCFRYDNFVAKFMIHQSGGKADHMKVAGMTVNALHRSKKKAWAMIDTIGEGAGVYSRLLELNIKNAISCKFSEGTIGLSDYTGQYKFANMRSYLHWCVRDWLNPKNKTGAMLPPDDMLLEEATSIKWSFMSSGSILIEKKDDIKSRIGRSPDRWDSLCNSFYPVRTRNGLTAEDIESDWD